MNGDTLFTIGDLARRTGLTVIAALTRLDLVRTLRDLGLDLAVIRQVLDREVSVLALPARSLAASIRSRGSQGVREGGHYATDGAASLTREQRLHLPGGLGDGEAGNAEPAPRTSCGVA